MIVELDHYALWTGLLGGLALFLFGMDQLTTALKIIAGDRMKLILARLTANRFVGALTGAVVTAVIQSSSVTTVILIGFISAGLMSMVQSVPVIMGANIGSTVTAQILAFKVTAAALPMIAVGFGASFLGRRSDIKALGTATMGLGFVFFGMVVMSDAMAPLRDYKPFLDIMLHMENPLLGVLIGALFTGLIQSSAATTGIVLVFGGQGLITLEGGIAIIIGANIGTCATASLASIGKPREAWRAAFVHVFFNIAGATIFVGLIPWLAQAAIAITPGDGAMPRQIANAHTLFNVANTAILIWFAPALGRLALKVIPPSAEMIPTEIRPKFLDKGMLGTPSLALDMARREVVRLAGRVEAMLREAMPAVLAGSKVELSFVADQDTDIDLLHTHIVDYLAVLSAGQLSDKENDQLVRLMEATRLLEHLGDVIKSNLIHVGRKRLEENIEVSAETSEVITAYHAQVLRAYHGLVQALEADDPDKAKRVRALKGDMAEATRQAVEHQMQRLRATRASRLAAYTREMEMIENLQAIFKLCRRLAKTVIPDSDMPELVPVELPKPKPPKAKARKKAAKKKT